MHTTRVYSSGAQTNLVSGYTYMRRSPEVDTSLPLLQSALTSPKTTHPLHSPSTLTAGKPSCFYECGIFKFASHRARGATHAAFFFHERIPAGNVDNKCNDDSNNILSECLHVSWWRLLWSVGKVRHEPRMCPHVLTGFVLRIPFGLRGNICMIVYVCVCACD